MKTTFLLALVLMLASYSISQDQVKISINKNSKGEMVFNVSGHTTPVALEVNGKTVNVEVGQSEVNMEEAFGFSEFAKKSEDMDVDTAAGTESSTGTDTQAPIPPVSTSINPNPPLATPY
jgi:hypothetical protein